MHICNNRNKLPRINGAQIVLKLLSTDYDTTTKKHRSY